MDSARAILEAVQVRLKADTSITELVSSRVYGAVPENPKYPFVLITIPNGQPFSADDINGMEHTLRVQGFAREGKPATVLAIREAVFASLNREEKSLEIDSGDTIIVEQGATGCFPEEDGRTYQSFIEFQVSVQ